MRRLMLPLVLLPLGACAENWVRPGTTVEEADREFTRCIQAARTEIPPRMERRQSAPERIVIRRVCSSQGGREVCRDEFVRRDPARYADVDTAFDARMARARACMVAQGFRREGLRLGPPTDAFSRP